MHITTSDEDRSEAIDVLRGFALLGILLVNVESFSMPAIVQFNPTAYGGDSWSNRLIHASTYVLARQKFMAIFSMLFGAGVLLLSNKNERIGQQSAWLHYARSFWLLVFGLFHAFLIWGGDVLVVYAGCAFFLYGVPAVPTTMATCARVGHFFYASLSEHVCG